MRDFRIQYLLVVALSVTLAVAVMLLMVPHPQASHVHLLGEQSITGETAAEDGTHLHRTYERPSDDLTRLRERMREGGGLPHLLPSKK